MRPFETEEWTPRLQRLAAYKMAATNGRLLEWTNSFFSLIFKQAVECTVYLEDLKDTVSVV